MNGVELILSGTISILIGVLILYPKHFCMLLYQQLWNKQKFQMLKEIKDATLR